MELLFSQLDTELTNSPRPGIGLAAIQIGITKQAFIIKIDPKGEVTKIWNPKVISTEGQKIVAEGCLSLPGITKSVARAESVVFENGDGKRYALDGLEAQVFLHEFDHIQGLCLLDKEHRSIKVGRNEPCTCGKRDANGNIVKYKKCHGK